MPLYMTVNPDRLAQDLKSCVCEVLFDMPDGQRRVLKATLMGRYLPEGYDMGTYVSTGGPDGMWMLVWDMDNNGWRSFPTNRVLSCQMIPGWN